MSDGLNRCTFIGNLGADPELRMTQSGQPVLKFRIGCTESYLDKSNTRQEKTEWVSCTVWGKRGEALSRILEKGKQVYVEGSLSTSSYEKNGEKRYSTEINVREVLLFGGRGQGAQSAPQAPSAAATRQPRQSVPQGPPKAAQDDYGDSFGGPDDEIPF